MAGYQLGYDDPRVDMGKKPAKRNKKPSVCRRPKRNVRLEEPGAENVAKIPKMASGLESLALALEPKRQNSDLVFSAKLGSVDKLPSDRLLAEACVHHESITEVSLTESYNGETSETQLEAPHADGDSSMIKTEAFDPAYDMHHSLVSPLVECDEGFSNSMDDGKLLSARHEMLGTTDSDAVTLSVRDAIGVDSISQVITGVPLGPKGDGSLVPFGQPMVNANSGLMVPTSIVGPVLSAPTTTALAQVAKIEQAPEGKGYVLHLNIPAIGLGGLVLSRGLTFAPSISAPHQHDQHQQLECSQDAMAAQDVLVLPPQMQQQQQLPHHGCDTQLPQHLQPCLLNSSLDVKQLHPDAAGVQMLETSSASAQDNDLRSKTMALLPFPARISQPDHGQMVLAGSSPQDQSHGHLVLAAADCSDLVQVIRRSDLGELEGASLDRPDCMTSLSAEEINGHGLTDSADLSPGPGSLSSDENMIGENGSLAEAVNLGGWLEKPEVERFVICSDGPMDCMLCAYKTESYSAFKSHIICSHPCWRITKKLSKNRLLVEKSVKMSMNLVPTTVQQAPKQQKSPPHVIGLGSEGQASGGVYDCKSVKKIQQQQQRKKLMLERNKRLFRCSMCLRLFVFEGSIVNHLIDYHEIKKPYDHIQVSNDHGRLFGSIHRCTQKNCFVSCASEDELERHRLESHAQVVYRCQICGFTADSTEAVKTHAMKIHRQQVMMYGLMD